MSYIDRAVMDLIKRGQSSRLLPASGKIYDITHADTNEHSVLLPPGYPLNTKAIYVRALRQVGTGVLHLRPTSGDGTSIWFLANYATGLWIRAVDGLFYYAMSIANDDWDIYAVGYFAG